MNTDAIQYYRDYLYNYKISPSDSEIDRVFLKAYKNSLHNYKSREKNPIMFKRIIIVTTSNIIKLEGFEKIFHIIRLLETS